MRLQITLPAPRRAYLKPLALGLALCMLGACMHTAEARSKKSKKHHKPATPVEVQDLVIYGSRPDVVAFSQNLIEQPDFDAETLAWAQAQLAQARYVPSVVKLIAPPVAGSAKNWQAYRARFVEPARIQAGVAFWNANEAWLSLAQARYGVAPEVIVGLMGVETYYGRVTGNFRVLDALATLSFDYPVDPVTGKDRSSYFRSELIQFLRLCRKEGLDATQPKGSFAGAMGLPQFMPSSWNRLAVDLDGDGHINLGSSAADAIGSVARYLADAGWQPGMPTHFAVNAPTEVPSRAKLLQPDILPTFTAAQMTDQGAVLEPAGLLHRGLLALVELQNAELAPSYVAGTANFYAVTRYNRSSYYALGVIELGRAVAQVRAASASPAPPLPETAASAAAPSAASSAAP